MSFGILLSTKKKLWIWKAYECLWHAGYRNRGRLIDWELGGRDRQTLRKLLDRLTQWQVTVYCTEHWEAYASELEEHPEAHHVETKTETRNIERNNMASPRFAIRSSSLVCEISSPVQGGLQK